jgi:cytochrome P450
MESRSIAMTGGQDPREGNQFFLMVPEKLDDPFPDLRYFLENRPVFYYPPLDQWFVFKYDDVSALFADPRMSADRMKGFIEAAPAEVRGDLVEINRYFHQWMLFKDGEDHARVRNFMQLGLSPQVIHSLLRPIQENADELLDRAQPEGRLDVGEEFGYLLPAYVLSDLFGVRRQDRPMVLKCSMDFVDFFNIIPITVETSRRVLESGRALIDYMTALINERRAQPRDDFLGTLVRSANQSGFSEDAIVANTLLVLLAGHIAVRNLIGNAVWLLLTHPDQRAAFQADPDLLHGVIEETLRLETPITMIPRIPLETIEVRGVPIPPSKIVQLCMAAANRDPDHYADPDRFDITRRQARALSFGNGPHTCIGAGLAMEVARIALATLFRRMPDLRLDESRPTRWYRNAGNRGPINLPVVFGVASSQ